MTLEGKRQDGSTYTIPLAHTFNSNQIVRPIPAAAGTALCACSLFVSCTRTH